MSRSSEQQSYDYSYDAFQKSLNKEWEGQAAMGKRISQ